MKGEMERTLRCDVEINSAGSGTLAQQILAGAPADVYFGADAIWIDELDRRGMIEEGTRQDLLRNRLVLINGITATHLPVDLSELSEFSGRIALGDPASVPAGRYATQALEQAGLSDELAARLLPAVDVKAAVAYVASGEAEFGIVYSTDVANTQAIQVVLEIERSLHDPITYPAAIVAGADDPVAAEQVLEFLSGEIAARAFEEAGFELLP